VRLAIVSPLPPAPTGIADYCADLVRLLVRRHDVELFHGQEEVDTARLPGECAARPASELPERHRARPYDVVVHHLGNNPAHAFQYGLLSRVPGLLVLHDLVLFHSRAAAFLDSPAVRAWRDAPADPRCREDARPALAAWREELLYSYPGVGERLYAAHLGTVGDLLPYAYPLFRIPVEASRAVAVHDAFLVDAVRDEVRGARVSVVPMPVEASPVAPGAAGRLRARLGFGPADVVVATFGLVTKEKRLATIARAVAELGDPRLRLLVVGPLPDRDATEALVARAGAAGRTVLTGRVPLAELPVHAAAADLVVHLRHPTGRETSAALLRVLAQGRPTVVSDLAHQAGLPDGAVWRIDPADEERSLSRALAVLANDADRRARLGQAAAAHVALAHAPGRVLDAWDEALTVAREAGSPASRPWPAHWPRPDP
jgi:glycosyltransferase involved in cell wall biosynthesis